MEAMWQSVFWMQGAEVYCLVRPESQKTECLPVHEHLHRIPAQMDEAVECVPQIGHADAFLHFAWRGVNRQEIDSFEVQKTNIDGSLRCIEAAKLLGCRIFMDAGSRVEYGITSDGIMEESMECHPVNEYGKAKLAFYEQAKSKCREMQMTYYHLRFFSVYGKGDHPWSIISTLTRELPEGKTVSLSACRHRWNFMDIEDASRAVVELYRYSDMPPGRVPCGECGFGGHPGAAGFCGGDPQSLRRKRKSGIRKLCPGKGGRALHLPGQ